MNKTRIYWTDLAINACSVLALIALIILGALGVMWASREPFSPQETTKYITPSQQERLIARIGQLEQSLKKLDLRLDNQISLSANESLEVAELISNLHKRIDALQKANMVERSF